MASEASNPRVEGFQVTLSETIGKRVLLMWGVETLLGAVITGKTTKLKIRIPMWPTVA